MIEIFSIKISGDEIKPTNIGNEPILAISNIAAIKLPTKIKIRLLGLFFLK